VATGERLYVVRLEPERARVVMGPKSALGCCGVELSEVNWLGDGPVAKGSMELEVKHRAREPVVRAHLQVVGVGRARVAFAEPQAGVAPGQACVFYQGTRVLGGGWIDRAPLAADG
jgi:tRNA-specific 2-thiouridylase